MTDAINKDRKFAIVTAVLLALLTFAVFQGVLHSDFITTDDISYILGNKHVTSGLSLRGISWAFITGSQSNWHPLTWISHMVDCSLYGTKPMGHHLTNLLLHIANVLLLFTVLRRMTGRTWRSAFVAALFAIHPLHVESVAWAAERKDVLSALFWMLTMWAYVRYVEARTPGRYALVLLSFALGLMSKPVLVTLPFALLLLDYWPLRRTPKRPWSSLVWEKVPLFMLAGASSIITYLVQRGGGAVSSLNDLPFGVRAANAVVAYMTYIWKMLLPRNLAIMYPHPSDSIPQWQVVGSALLLIALTLAVIAGRKRRYLPVGWLWYIGTLIPMIGLVQVGSQAMADRYTYLPLIGLFLIIAWFPERWGDGVMGRPSFAKATEGKWGGKVVAALACLVIVALGIAGRIQVGYWKDAGTVFTHANKVTKNNYLANNELGNVMGSRKRLNEAARYYSRALEISPNAERSHLGMGLVLARQRKFDQAMPHFRAAIAARPQSSDPRPYHVVADILIERNKPEEALAACRKALKIAPDDAIAHFKIAMILISQKDILGAVPHLEQAVELNPDYPEAHYNLGTALASQGDLDGAVSHFLRAVEARPNYGRARESLAQAYYVKGDYAAAWKEVRFCRKYGYKPDPGFIQALSEKMPEK